MPHLEAERFRARLDATFLLAETAENEDVRDHLSRYLCILVSGYLETSIREMLLSYTDGKCHPRIRNFVEDKLKYFQNPRSDRIEALLRSFDINFVESAKREIQREDIEAIDSIIARRNQIAHGSPAGISLGTLKDYRTRAERALLGLKKILQH